MLLQMSELNWESVCVSSESNTSMVALFPGLLSSLFTVQHSRRRPGPFYHMMRAAGVYLRHTQLIALTNIAVLQR